MAKPKAIKGMVLVKTKPEPQDKIYRATKGMTSAQRVQYMRDQLNGTKGDLRRRPGKTKAKS